MIRKANGKLYGNTRDVIYSLKHVRMSEEKNNHFRQLNRNYNDLIFMNTK